MTNEQIWQTVLGEVELTVSKANFITWFKNTSVANQQNGVIVVNVPNGFTKEWLENKYNKFILKSLKNILPEIKEIKYVIGKVIIRSQIRPQIYSLPATEENKPESYSLEIQEKDIPLGLLTGNVKRGAQIKLNRFDLMKHFSFGAFGDDGETRNDLPIIARYRAQEILGKSFKFEDIVLIGDTPEDAIAAKVNGCKSIVVCRRQEWYDDIVKAGADLIVDSLDDPAIEI